MGVKAGNIASEQLNLESSFADLAEEANQAANAEVAKIHELQKKLLLDRMNFEERLRKKQEATRLLNEKKILLELDKYKKKHSNISADEEIKYKQKLEKKYAKQAAQDAALDRRKQLKEEYEEIKRRNDELNEAFGNSLGRNIQTAFAKYQADGGIKQDLKNTAKNLGKNVVNVGKQIISEGTKAVDTAMNMYAGVYSKMNARLQGSNKSAQGIFDLMNKNLAISPYISYQDMLNNTAELINQGIAYNVEERAFLMTIKDKIADTFDVANGTLLQIIRIQQQDSTRARMGMEASLTAFLNSNFQDTSYLSQVYDTVTDAVADSVVQLGTKGGAEYEYQMQKWLGSLYSMGISSNTVTSLASAINMLATGDVTGLEGSGMQNLLVMAANKSGMNYGDLLTQGVNASNLNALMSNIVSYWSELAQNNNQVVRKQYAGLFGLDMADLVAIRNVDQSLMKTLTTTNLDYTGMNTELASQLNAVQSRMHVSELINNAYENVVSGIGRSIANSPGMMSAWLINSMIKEATGGINIPFITAMGSGIGLETDLNSLVQLGLVGAGTLGQISNIINGLNSNGGLNLNAWNSTDTNTRGTGLGGVVSGVQGSVSRTTFVGNANSSDIYSSTLNAAYDNVDTTVSNQAQEEADKMKEAIIDHIDPNIEAILNILKSVTNGTSLRVQVEDYGLTSPF